MSRRDVPSSPAPVEERGRSAACHVSLAGGLALRCGTRRAGHQQLRGRQLPLVVAVLVLRRHEPVPVDFLADQLWPHQVLPDRWRTAVRGLVSQFRHVLADIGVGTDDPVVAVAGSYVVDLPGLTVDVEAVPGLLEEGRAALARGDVAPARERASAARAITSRPVLAGVDAPWLEELRTGLQRQRLEALDLLAACRSRTGEHADAVAVAQEAVSLDSYRETAWRRLMQTHVAAGNPAAALRVYEACRELLAHELGVAPSAETQSTYLDLLRAVPDEGLVLPSRTTRPAVETDRTPYRGLLPFDTDDADLFFGRDAHVQELLDRLHDHDAIVVSGPSGSGKSSLVRAGLVPALATGALPESDTWVVTLVVPGDDPLKALGRALEVEGGPAAADVAAGIREEPGSLRAFVEQALGARGAASTARLLVVVDQAEELFTVCTDAAARAAFVASLLRASAGHASRLRVVLTLRADFYGEAAALPDLADLLSASQYVVPPLDGDGIEAAVVGPARLVGARLEDGLVGRILEDVLGEPGALPLLQHALLELWTRRRADDVLTLDSYAEVGGVPGALTHRAETLFQLLDRDSRELARRILLGLVSPGRGTRDTRRSAPLRDLRPVGVPPKAVDDLITRLVDARLLALTTDPWTRDVVVDLAHEAMIEAWPRLRGWIDRTRSDLLLHQRLADAVRTWRDHDEHPDFLLTGEPLAEAGRLRDQAPGPLSPDELRFLELSRRTEDAALHERTRSRRIDRSRSLARDSQAQRNQDQDLALLLAVRSIEALEGDPVPPDVWGALHQSVVAHRVVRTLAMGGIATSFLADGRLLTAYQPWFEYAVWNPRTGERLVVLEPSGSRAGVDGATSPDGGRFAEVYSFGNDTIVWDLHTGHITHRLPAASAIQDAPSFGPGGRLLAVANKERNQSAPNSVSVFDLDDGAEVARVAVPGIVARTAIHPASTILATADWTAPLVRLWDLETGAVVDQPSGPARLQRTLGLAFHPAGDRLLVLFGGPPYEVHDLDLATRQVRAVIDVAGQGPWDLDLSRDGRTLALLTPGEGIEVHDLDGRRPRRHVPWSSAEGSPACHPTGALVAAGSRSGRSTVWDVRPEATAELWSVGVPAPWSAVWVADGVVSSHRDGTLRRIDDGVVSAVGDVPISNSGGNGWWVTPSPDGRYVATNTPPPSDVPASTYPLQGEGRLVLRDARSLAVVRELPPGGVPFDFSADGQRLLVGSWELGVAVHDVATGDVVTSLDLPVRNLPWGAFHPDGRHVVVRHWDREIWVCDLRHRTILATACASGEGLGCAVSPDGSLLATAVWSNDTVEVFDLDALREASPGLHSYEPDQPLPGIEARRHVLPRQHRAMLSFSPDGSRLATASPVSGDVTLWDTGSGDLLLRIPHDGGTGGASFSPDGSHLVVTLFANDGDHAVRLYTLDLDELLHIAGRKATRELTDAERELYGLL